jgi:hypothetical protein
MQALQSQQNKKLYTFNGQTVTLTQKVTYQTLLGQEYTYVSVAKPKTEPSDSEVKTFIQLHPDGAAPEDIADYFGVTSQQICNLIKSATNKFRAAATKKGLEPKDLDVLLRRAFSSY